jgi:hypothetical protein
VAHRIRPMERRRRATFRMITNIPHGNLLPDRVLRWGVLRPRSLKEVLTLFFLWNLGQADPKTSTYLKCNNVIIKKQDSFTGTVRPATIDERHCHTSYFLKLVHYII